MIPYNQLNRDIGMVSKISNEIKNGLILIFFTVLAIAVCNSPLSEYYYQILDMPIMLAIASYKLSKPLILWVNEGFMAIFFLYVTLEIKEEMINGTLDSWGKRALPFFAAIGGMLIPALCYIYITSNTKEVFDGWAIPTATDIVFSLSVLAMIYRGNNNALRVFLLSLAVFDDIGAIAIIAFYYTSNILISAIITATIAASILFLLNLCKINNASPYMIVGTILWVATLKSGVHATLAGIAIALALPNCKNKQQNKSVSNHIEHSLKPWINYFILPIFAFVNAGISFNNSSLSHIFDNMTIAIIVGLFFGKQIGIIIFSYLGIKLRLATMPEGLDWKGIYGVSLLCGIGFTMSLFIGTLAFEAQLDKYAVWIKMGVILGSLLSAITATLYFKLFLNKNTQDIC